MHQIWKFLTSLRPFGTLLFITDENTDLKQIERRRKKKQKFFQLSLSLDSLTFSTHHFWFHHTSLVQSTKHAIQSIAFDSHVGYLVSTLHSNIIFHSVCVCYNSSSSFVSPSFCKSAMSYSICSLLMLWNEIYNEFLPMLRITKCRLRFLFILSWFFFLIVFRSLRFWFIHSFNWLQSRSVW